MITFASGLYDLLPLVSFSAEREPREREGAAAERDVGAGAVALPAAQGPPRRPQGLQGQLSLSIIFTCGAKRYAGIVVVRFIFLNLLLLATNEQRPKQPKQTW